MPFNIGFKSRINLKTFNYKNKDYSNQYNHLKIILPIVGGWLFYCIFYELCWFLCLLTLY